MKEFTDEDVLSLIEQKELELNKKVENETQKEKMLEGIEIEELRNMLSAYSPFIEGLKEDSITIKDVIANPFLKNYVVVSNCVIDNSIVDLTTTFANGKTDFYLDYGSGNHNSNIDQSFNGTIFENKYARYLFEREEKGVAVKYESGVRIDYLNEDEMGAGKFYQEEQNKVNDEKMLLDNNVPFIEDIVDIEKLLNTNTNIR